MIFKSLKKKSKIRKKKTLTFSHAFSSCIYQRLQRNYFLPIVKNTKSKAPTIKRCCSIKLLNYKGKSKQKKKKLRKIHLNKLSNKKQFLFNLI